MPIDFDCFGKKQTKDQVIARVTTMFQAGILTSDVAKVIIGMAKSGVEMTPESIQTAIAKLGYKDIQREKQERQREREREEAKRLRAQGAISPTRKLSLG